MWNVWMTESCLPCFIKMYLRFHSTLATPMDCGSAKVSALLSTKLSLHFNLKRSWICFILPYKSFPEPGGCPIDSHQIPLNFVFSLSTLYGNFQKGSLFFQNSRCAFLLQKPRKLFWCAEFKVMPKRIQTIVCIEMKAVSWVSSE